MKWFLPVLLVAVISICTAGAQERDALTRKVAGVWGTGAKKKVTLNPDGTMHDDSGVKGTWKWLDETERKIDVDEGKDGRIYNMSFDNDWKGGAGKVHGNRRDERAVGMGIKFTRLEAYRDPDALTKSILTAWQKTGGEIITLHWDGTMSGSRGSVGSWNWVNRQKGTFEVSHGPGQAAYLLTLAADARTATGKVHKGDPAKIGKVIDLEKVDASAPASTAANIPTLGGPPITKSSATPPPAEPGKTPPVTSSPPAPEPKELSATGKWLAEQDAQWQATFDREVSGEFIRGRDELKKQYLASLEARLAQASREAKLDEAVEARAERDRIAAGGEILENGDAAISLSLKGLRASFSPKWTALVEQRAAKARSLFDRYDGILNQFQIRLTQNQRLDEALEIKSKREQISAAWLKEPALGAGKGK